MTLYPIDRLMHYLFNGGAPWDDIFYTILLSVTLICFWWAQLIALRDLKKEVERE